MENIWRTCIIESQLFADNSSIIVIPVVIANCAPAATDENLHSPFVATGTPNQSEVAIRRSYKIKRLLPLQKVHDTDHLL